MIRSYSLRLTFATLMILSSAFSFAAERIISRPASVAEALEYCSSATLDVAEGIWEFPEDMTMVLICKNEKRVGAYKIILLQGPDCSFRPGEICGELEPTAHKNKYRLSLSTGLQKHPLSSMQSCTAELGDDNTGFYIHPGQLNVKLRNLGFLSRFWRSVSISVEKPAEKLPLGMRRVLNRPGSSRIIYF